MKRHCLVAFLCIMTAGTVAGQQAPNRFVSFALLADYPGAEYVAQPELPSRHVYFVGETIPVELRLHNGEGVSRTYRVPDDLVNGLFRVTTRNGPVPGIRPRFEATVYMTLPDGVTHPPLRSNSTIDVPPGGSVVFRTTLQGVSVPGSYELSVVPAFDDINPRASLIRFELRASTERPARAELIRRQMLRDLRDGDCVRARSESSRLLQLHPSSSSAFRVQGECAEREREPQGAAAAYERARELLILGQDDLYLANADRNRVSAAIDALTAAADRARGIGR